MTPAADRMMTVAEAGTNTAMFVVLAIFVVGVALYYWSRPRS